VARRATGADADSAIAATVAVADEITSVGDIAGGGAELGSTDETESGARAADSGVVATAGAAEAAAEEGANACSTAGWTAATAAGAT
jgi:hypothetical protein